MSMPPHLFTPERLLQAADQIMRMAQPAFQASFHFSGWRYRAKWEYPGVLSVWCGETGAMLARSRPGHPTKPAASGRRAATPADRLSAAACPGDLRRA